MGKTIKLPASLFPLVSLLICFLWPSFYGLNFGTNWDENVAKFDSVRNSVNTGVFMQSAGEPTGWSYNYGGVNYLLTWSGFAPEILRYLSKGPFTREGFSQAIGPVVYDHPIKMRVRSIYLILCSLSIVWLYCLNLVFGRTRLEAFLAAAILCCSWEFAYHSRWIAPDGIMMQFALLSFLCLALGYTRRTTRWFYMAAIAAGLAAGSKYPGAMVLPLIMVGSALIRWREQRSVVAVLKESCRVAGVAITTFVITTPGVLLDPFRFFGEVQAQRDIYATGWYGYTVTPGIHHFLEIVQYFSLQVFSHYWSLSILFAVFCLVGFIALGLEFRLLGIMILVFTVAYLAYFSQQAAMIVRNLLVVVPFLCLASARGIMVAAQRLGIRLNYGLAALVGLSLLVNFGWEIYAAEQVKKKSNTQYFLKQFTEYVTRSPTDTVLISAKLSGILHESQRPVPGNVVTDPSVPHTKVAFLQAEGAEVFWLEWPSNWWGIYEATFGALEVNLEAYSTFVGNQRIILTTTEHFSKLPIKEKDLSTP